MLGELGSKLFQKALEQLLPGDALQGAVSGDLLARLEPHITSHVAAVRAALLTGITPAPPATYRDELASVGLALSDEQIPIIWAATFRAIAAELARPRLTAISGGQS